MLSDFQGNLLWHHNTPEALTIFFNGRIDNRDDLSATLNVPKDLPIEALILAVVLAQVRDPIPLPSTIDASIGARAEQVLLKALAKLFK